MSRRSSTWLVALLSSTSLAAGTAARAAEEPKNLNDTRLDLSVPDIPAFTALGTGAEASRPGSVQELAVALANGLSRDGKVQSGVAIEVSPAKLAGSAEKALTALRLSIATSSKAEGSATRTEAAVGGRWALVTYDPGADENLKRCLGFVLPRTPPQAKEPPPKQENGARQPPKEIAQTPAMATCRSAYRAANLAVPSATIAATYTWGAVGDSRFRDFGGERGSVWLALAYAYNSVADGVEAASAKALTGAGTWDQELGAATHGHPYGIEPLLFARLDVERSRTGHSGAKTLTALARLPVIWDGASLFVEGGTKVDDQGSGVAATWSFPVGAGSDLRLSNGTWLGIYYGFDAAGKQGMIALANLKWAYGESRPYHYP